MILEAIFATTVEKYPVVQCEYREVSGPSKTHLIKIIDPGSPDYPGFDKSRLFLNGKPTKFYESGMGPSVRVVERRETRDVYVQSSVNVSGAILVTKTQLLWWDRKRLQRCDGTNLDLLEYHLDGRLLGIRQFDSFASVGRAENGWDQDRAAFVILHGKAIPLGGAVNAWFENDGSIRGISNGSGPLPKYHSFSFRNGKRKDEAVQTTPLKRPHSRLFGLAGVGEPY